MKILTKTLLALVFPVVLFACTKEAPDPAIVGTWEFESYAAQVDAADPDVETMVKNRLAFDAELLKIRLLPATFRDGIVTTPALVDGSATEPGQEFPMADKQRSYTLTKDSIHIFDRHGDISVLTAAYACTVDGDRMIWKKTFDPADDNSPINRHLEYLKRWRSPDIDWTIHSASETIVLKRK